MSKRKSKVSGRDYKYEGMTSAPTKIGKAVVYMQGPEGEGPVHVFGEVWCAKRFCDEVLGEGEGTWEEDVHNRFWVKNSSGWKVGGDMIEEIMEHEYVGEEETYDIFGNTPNMQRWLMQYTGRIVPTLGLNKEEKNPQVKDRIERKARKKVRKEVIDGYVSLVAICEDVGIKPAEGRKLLRKAMETPEGGWVFREEEVEKIKEILNG